MLQTGAINAILSLDPDQAERFQKHNGYYSVSVTWMVNFAFVWAVLAQNAPETGARSVE